MLRGRPRHLGGAAVDRCRNAMPPRETERLERASWSTVLFSDPLPGRASAANRAFRGG